MKIGLVILHADPRRGGAERYTVDLAHALGKRGHVVSIVATTFPVMFSDITSAHLPTDGFTRAKRYKQFLNAFDNHLHIAPYDVVHAMLPIRQCDLYHPHAGLAAAAVARGHQKHRGLLARAVTYVLNNLNPRRRAMARVEKKLLTGGHPPVVLCLSDYVKSSVREFYPLDDAHLATLFNAVDLQKFDPAIRPEARVEVRGKYAIPADATVALMVAQDFGRKGLAEAMRAMAIKVPEGGDPSASKFKLLVVGGGDEISFRRLAIRSGVGDRVIFAGPSDDVVGAYHAADFFVLPTRHDPCSLVVLEALAMGLPVITTKQNGASEIMADNVHGFVLPNNRDLPALAATMQTLCNPVRRAAMRESCLALRPKLSFDRHVDDLLAIYQRVTGRWR